MALVRTGYFLSAANVLKAVKKFAIFLRETFFNSIDLAVINQYDESAVMQISTVLGHVYHVACQRVLSNATF